MPASLGSKDSTSVYFSCRSALSTARRRRKHRVMSTSDEQLDEKRPSDDGIVVGAVDKALTGEQPALEQPVLEQLAKGQASVEQTADGKTAAAQPVGERSEDASITEKQTVQMQPSKKLRADARPVEEQPVIKWSTKRRSAAASTAAKEQQSRKWRAISRPTEESETTATSMFRNYLQAQEQLRVPSDNTRSQQPSELRFASGRQSNSRPSFIQTTTSSFCEGRVPLENPEIADRKRRYRQDTMVNQHMRTYARQTQHAIDHDSSLARADPVQPPVRKREGVGFSYSDSLFQSFQSFVNAEEESLHQVVDQSTQSPPRSAPATKHQNPFEVIGLKSSLPQRKSMNEESRHTQLSFSSTASTALNGSFDDMVVMREIGSFYIDRPQRILPCTVATREDTIRLRADAKFLFDKYAESADVQAALLIRLERMVLTAQDEVARKDVEPPTLVSHALKLHDYLLRTQRDRIETGELRRAIEHEIKWAEWLAEASRTGVMHKRTGDCKCRPDWEENK
ncbi:hypothetical protein T440DRAFT_417478 [Plenodomus tracheiphilus IPT5]|uniref:Uncharacterized protein n=1 Tax=Plenodomus tracheiphilus IPT5 TaxID=1408161 RepID=A0A6A7BGB5_9PLEO|nr:hypothetical protein T440DRAFT_417478 [Plenodomus tracheiphilus IPT5]